MTHIPNNGPESFDLNVERNKARLVFWLFIASLGMFFAALILIYILLMNGARAGSAQDREAVAAFANLQLPTVFWVSTAVLVVISVVLQLATSEIAADRKIVFNRWLNLSLFLGAVFLALQYWGLDILLNRHFGRIDGFNRLFGVCFVISMIHALHVVGGVVYIGFLKVQAGRDKYHAKRYWAVAHCASYWHFLGVVWIGMLAVFIFC